MSDQHHYVSGFFATRPEALKAQSELRARGLPGARLQLFETAAPPPGSAPRHESNAVLKDVVLDGAVGTVVGTGIGALAQVALVSANVTLLIASPLVAPLVMLGWGASLGALIGSAVGATTSEKPLPAGQEGWLSALVGDAISKGQVVLVAETRTAQETATAREVIQAAVGGYKDVVTA